MVEGLLSEVFGLLGIFSGSFVLAMSGALMPGPLLTVTITESVRKGMWVGPVLITGHGLLELSLVVFIIFGLGPFLERPGVIGTIALLGGMMLFWMGMTMFKAAGDLELEMDVKGSPCGPNGESKVNTFCLGILASISNPYWTLWWVTIGLGYLTSSLGYGWPGVVSFFSGHILADYAWYAFVSLCVSKGRALLTTNHYRLVIRTCAVFLVVFGGWFISTAFMQFT